MPTCTRCGAFSPAGSSNCNKCGIPFASQIRADAAAKTAQTGKIVRTGLWIVTAIVVAVAAPRVYHAADGAYLKHHLKSLTDDADKDCGGPITSEMRPDQKEQINKCLDGNADLTKAKADYANFTKS